MDARVDDGDPWRWPGKTRDWLMVPGGSCPSVVSSALHIVRLQLFGEHRAHRPSQSSGSSLSVAANARTQPVPTAHFFKSGPYVQ